MQCGKEVTMKRILPVLILLVIIVGIIFIFFKNNNKLQNLGNTMSKIKNLETYILQINSYEAVAEITITSNKTTNHYKVRQMYLENGSYEQEVMEPETISGTKIIYDGKTLTLQNTKLNLSKIYENYQYIASNELGLQYFIQDYKESEDASFREEETEVILETTVKNANRYVAKKVLHVDKSTGKPKSLEIRDNTQNILVYILYNEIKINDGQKEVLAFKTEEKKSEI